ncbi:MAG: phospholipid carrier-dependent glycosyltransferase [Chloroflexales bacterium]|nr:phospholipid carrier-dependent glycosyltransferase [Chloroflexales bacterium]
MIQPFEAEGAARRSLAISLRADQVLFLVLMVAIVGVRVANLRYNSLFVDEAIYATVGRNALVGTLDSNPLTWMYGSYLYPTLAAIIDYATGEVGLRLVSVVLSSAAACLVYLATLRLFEPGAAVWATLFFGMTAISIDLGQYAVYDAPVILALACCLYLIVRAAEAPVASERRLLLIASAALVGGTLTKYFAALYLPALLCIGAACALRQGRSLWPLLAKFLAPAAAVLCGYAWVNREELAILLAGGYGVVGGERTFIFADMWAEIGVTSLIALGGLAVLIRRGLTLAPQLSFARQLLWALLILALIASLFAAPIYHLVTANQHAAWKHSAYSLLFLAPLAGYCCDSLVRGLRSPPGWGGRIAGATGAVVSAALVIWGLDYALNRNWGFQNSWPNTRGAVAYLEASGLTPGRPVLAEGAPIYEYYLDPGPQYRAMWTSTWYASYANQTGIAAMEAAIADHYYQAVILDGYHTPALRERLEAALQGAGYTLGYTETQPLSLGFSAHLAVYRAP